MVPCARNQGGHASESLFKSQKAHRNTGCPTCSQSFLRRLEHTTAHAPVRHKFVDIVGVHGMLPSTELVGKFLSGLYSPRLQDTTCKTESTQSTFWFRGCSIQRRVRSIIFFKACQICKCSCDQLHMSTSSTCSILLHAILILQCSCSNYSATKMMLKHLKLDRVWFSRFSEKYEIENCENQCLRSSNRIAQYLPPVTLRPWHQGWWSCQSSPSIEKPANEPTKNTNVQSVALLAALQTEWRTVPKSRLPLMSIKTSQSWVCTYLYEEAEKPTLMHYKPKINQYKSY